MLPDFPDLKRELEHYAADYINRKVAEIDPLVGGLKRTVQHEGRDQGRVRDGAAKSEPYERVGGHTTIDRPTLAQLTFAEMQQHLDVIAHQLAEGQAKHVFRALRAVAHATGNAVDGHGTPLSFEHVLEILGRMDIEFDERGQAIMPALIVAPDVEADIKAILTRANADPECRARFHAVMKRKLEEWRDREARRQLAD
jgi:hypothetical protein